jgi:pimeloyl-ACP methyl ester carboxylesterase
MSEKIDIENDSPQVIRANEAEFHYLERGTGTPVMFVHGGLVDYRRWMPQIEAFSQQHRVITYSRRYNFPNRNAVGSGSYSAIVDADDLAGIIRELNLGPCHIIGESYGAYAALFLAARYPDLACTLVLAEPPVLPWLGATSEGTGILDEFLDGFWKQVGESLGRGDRLGAMQTIVGHFMPGAGISDLPDDLRSVIDVNLKEWTVLTASGDPFPDLSRHSVAGLEVPVLLLSGEQTLPEHRIIDAELERLLLHASRIVVEGTTHEMWDEQPAACQRHALQFISSNEHCSMGTRVNVT